LIELKSYKKGFLKKVINKSASKWLKPCKHWGNWLFCDENTKCMKKLDCKYTKHLLSLLK